MCVTERTEMSVTMKKKVIGIVVTFNRKELLRQNLSALLRQTRKLDEIVVVDNASTDGTGDYIQDLLEANPVIDYHLMEENTGGSGGFSKAIEIAYEHGADYIWGMDDDAIPDERALEYLLKAAVKTEDRAALWSNCNGQCEHSLTRVKTWMFVGFFLPRQIVQDAGFPRSDYFIYWDDHEYALRIQKAGYRIYKVKQSVIHHKDANTEYYPVKKLGPIEYKMFKMSDWKMYYYLRNKILTYGWNEKEKYYAIFIDAPKDYVKSLVYHTGQSKIVAKALRDGIRGKSGKQMSPG